MPVKSLNRLKRNVWPVVFVLLSLFLIGVGMKSADTPNINSVPATMESVSGGYLAAEQLAAKVNVVLKAELEKEFGPLNDQIRQDSTEIYGRVIVIDYLLPEDVQLDETWGNKVVKAVGRLGITAAYEGNEVRAEDQEIAGEMASSIQFTTAQGYEEPDVIGFVAMFMEN